MKTVRIVNAVIKLMLSVYSVSGVSGHARMLEPPARSSMWRFGFDTPINYNDNQLFCGGYRNTVLHDGKCGVCGDPFQGPYENEAGGKFGTGVIGRYYDDKSRVINVTIDVSAHHRGHFEFRICPNNDVNKRVTQDCLNNNVLVIKEGKKQGDGKIFTPPKTGIHHLHLEIPRDLVCSQCVLQWKYTTGNFWGRDDDGTTCIGCGTQEQFVNCADIAIRDKSLFSNSNSTVKNKTINTENHHLHSNGRNHHANVYHDDNGHQGRYVDKSNHKNSLHGSDNSKRNNNHNRDNGHHQDRKSDSVTSYKEIVATNSSYSSARPVQCNRCYALPTWHHFPEMDDWCETNCKLGNCPPCRCYCGCPDMTFDNPCKGKNEYNQYSKMADWCWRECCESECPNDRCACSDDVKYPASYGVRIQKQFFDAPMIHLYPGSQNENDDIFKNSHKTEIYRHEENAHNSHIMASDKNAASEELSTLPDKIVPPEASLLTTNLFSNLWNKQWITLSGKIQPLPTNPKTQGKLYRHAIQESDNDVLVDKTGISETIDSKALGHSRGKNVVISLPEGMKINNDKQLVSEVPVDLLGHGDDDHQRDTDESMAIHQNLAMAISKEKISKQKLSILSHNFPEHLHDDVANMMGKIEDGKEDYKDNIKSNETRFYNDVMTSQNTTKRPQNTSNINQFKKENVNLDLKITQDNSVENINDIVTNDLNLDKLLKVSDTNSSANAASYRYIYASPANNGISSKGDNSKLPYIVDKRFLNDILKSVKSWFNHSMYVVH